jgi:hypothetical protein
MLAKLWVNRLRSNAALLELCKLDIESTRNNLYVRRATLIGISLVLFHCPHMKGPKPSPTKMLQLGRERTPPLQ